MTPLSSVLQKLTGKGYQQELQLTAKGAIIKNHDHIYKAQDLRIVRTYRFEGESDPADMAVLYVIETHDGQKAILLNAYGTYADQDTDNYAEFIAQVPINEKAELAALGH